MGTNAYALCMEYEHNTKNDHNVARYSIHAVFGQQRVDNRLAKDQEYRVGICNVM